MAVISLNSSEAWNEIPGLLSERGLNETILLNKQGPISFSWTDFEEACRFYQEKISLDPIMRKQYETKICDLEKLRLMPIWIRGLGETIHTSLFDLYQDFILERSWKVDSHQPVSYNISFISPSGPYKKLAITDCFNVQTYHDFILIFLLQSKLPQRDFRLRTNSRLLIEFGKNYNEAGIVDLEQVTSGGILLRCQAKQFFLGIRPHGKLNLLIKTSDLEEVSKAHDWQSFKTSIAKWGANPFYTQNKQESFNLDCTQLQTSSRFDFSQTNDIYLYLKFETLKTSHELMALRLEKFITKGRDVMKQLLAQRAA
jgi:hypothetical protein